MTVQQRWSSGSDAGAGLAAPTPGPLLALSSVGAFDEVDLAESPEGGLAVHSVPAPGAIGPGSPMRTGELSGLVLTVSAVAARLGVAPATLRTWDRRYGLGPSGHASGSHRRYAPADVARLELMQRALLRGASPGDAARYALVAEIPLAVEAWAAEPAPPESGAVVAPLAPIAREPSAPREGQIPEALAAYLAASPTPATALATAVAAGDLSQSLALIDQSIATADMANTWAEQILPVAKLAFVQDAASTGEPGRVIETAVVAIASKAMVDAPIPTSDFAILILMPPGGVTALASRWVAACLATRCVRVHLVPSRMPLAKLAAAIDQIGASAVLLWGGAPLAVALPALADERPTARLVLAGRGFWEDRSDVDARMLTVGGVFEATELLTALARPVTA